jgi:hypothetical protein
MKKLRHLLIALAVSLGVLTNAAQAANTVPWQTGVMVGNPENGASGILQDFATSVYGSTSALAPLTMLNTYLTPPTSGGTGNNGYNVSEWDSTAPWDAGCGSGNCTVTPLIGLPMTVTGNTNAQNITYLQSITSGAEDSMYQTFVQEWAAAGYKNQVWRPGVEMNLQSTAGNYGSGGYASTPAIWVSAFQHIYTVLHAAAVTYGVNLKIDWNPGITSGQGDGQPTTTFWPGKAYVDVVAGDWYSPLYGNLYDWSANSQTYNSSGSSVPVSTIVQNTVDLQHYYMFPAANSQGPDGSCTNSDSGASNPYAICGQSLSFYNLITFAKAQGLPIALDEVGTDQGNGGPVTNTVFPGSVRSALNYASSIGVTVDHVSVWDNSGCNCTFTPTTGDGSTATATAWGNSLQGTPPTKAPSTPTATGTQINGPIGSLQNSTSDTFSINTAGQIVLDGAIASYSHGVVTLFQTATGVVQLAGGNWYLVPADGTAGAATTQPSGYVVPHAASAATQVNGTSGSFWDQWGNLWAINSSQQITVNGTVVPSANVLVLYWDGTSTIYQDTITGWYFQPEDGSAGAATTAPAGYSASGPAAISLTPATLSVAGVDYTSAYPFQNGSSGVTINDPNAGQTESATVVLNTSANGTMQDPNSPNDGSTISGTTITIPATTAANLQADLAGIIFIPTKNQVANGATVTSTITATLTDHTLGQTATSVSTMVITQINQNFNGSHC